MLLKIKLDLTRECLLLRWQTIHLLFEESSKRDSDENINTIIICLLFLLTKTFYLIQIWFNVHLAFNLYINYCSFISYFFTCSNFLIASRKRTSVSPSVFHIEKLTVKSSHPYSNAVLHLPSLVNELLINTLKSYFSWPRAELKVGSSVG